MTTPEDSQSRPVPDLADLRLLGEIINNGAIGLPQAAWNAGMSQSEAADRLVTMAERGMPLRLVAEGDRQQLWHIAQAGPPPAAAPPNPAPAVPGPPVPPPPVAAPPNPPPPAHEPAREPVDEPAATWGVPGTSDWVRPTAGGEPAEPVEAPLPVEPTRRVLTSGEPVQFVVGLFGEQLDVGLQQILDPADDILTKVGYRIEDGERALLVQTSVGNRGPVAYEALADLYLELVDAAGTVLRKAAMSVAGHQAHQVGVPPYTLVSGWTVFLVPAGTEVAQVRWSIRPDLVDRTVSWGFGPAPVE